jgi:hypothetical protein
MKEMERELGLAYSTVRARLDEAFVTVQRHLGGTIDDRQKDILGELDSGRITVPEAIRRLRELQPRRET